MKCTGGWRETSCGPSFIARIWVRIRKNKMESRAKRHKDVQNQVQHAQPRQGWKEVLVQNLTAHILAAEVSLQAFRVLDFCSALFCLFLFLSVCSSSKHGQWGGSGIRPAELQVVLFCQIHARFPWSHISTLPFFFFFCYDFIAFTALLLHKLMSPVCNANK